MTIRGCAYAKGGMAFAGPRGMRGFLQDLRQALRRLVAAPGFAIVAIVALALGIGANTAIFTVVDAALLRPLPYVAADRLVTIEATSSEDARAVAVTGADFLDLRGLASVTGVTAMRGLGMNLAGERPERVSGAVVSSNFFSVLGIRLLAGRGLEPASSVAMASSASDYSPKTIARIDACA